MSYMLLMEITTPLTPAARFAQIVDDLLATLRLRCGGIRLAGPLFALLWNRLRRMQRRFAALAEQVRAGTLPAAAPAPAPRPAVADRPAAAARPQRPSDLLPRQFGWLLKAVPESHWVAATTAQMEAFLLDPEAAALVSATPQFGRVLRPFCRMLAVKPPPALALPPKPRPPRPPREPRPKIPLCPHRGRWVRRWHVPKWQRDRDNAEYEAQTGKKWT